MAILKHETRRVLSPLELRKSASGLRTLTGRGITYRSLSKDLGGFKEQFLPGSITVDPLCRTLYNHDTANLLGTVKSGTMSTEDRVDGLYYTCTLPDTQLGRDVQTLIERGDIALNDSVSFGFIVNGSDGESWEQQDSQVIRSIKSATLLEISVLGGEAAYSDNTVSLRGVPAKLKHLVRDAGDAQDIDPDYDSNCSCDPDDPNYSPDCNCDDNDNNRSLKLCAECRANLCQRCSSLRSKRGAVDAHGLPIRSLCVRCVRGLCQRCFDTNADVLGNYGDDMGMDTDSRSRRQLAALLLRMSAQ